MAETEQTTATTPAIAYEYVWFGGQPVAQFDAATNTPHWTFTDHLGTPILKTNTAGAVDWRAEYDPYGTVNTLRAGAARHQPLRFPGQEYDEASADREYNLTRWYRPAWDRYTQPDPIGLRGGTNLVAYVGGNPVRFIDPLGEDIEIRKGTQDSNDPAWMAYHEAICVDTWHGCKNGCPGKSMGKLCFTFGWINKWKVAAPSFHWLGQFTPWINPGTGMVGEVYVTDTPPNVVAHKSTDCTQDLQFVKKLLGIVGTQDTYTCGFYNCVNWVHSMFDQAP